MIMAPTYPKNAQTLISLHSMQQVGTIPLKSQ